MFKLIKENRFFFYPYFIILIFSLIILFTVSKADIHITINQIHANFFDSFFEYFTHLGDDIILISITLLMFFIRYRYAIILAVSNIFASIIVTYLKRFPFVDYPRPKLFFSDKTFYSGDYQLYFAIPQDDVGIWYPFPSGHTKAAFILFLFFAMIYKNKENSKLEASIKIMFLVLACAVGYSRMYLSQHFFMDVVGGSVIGILCTVPVFYWFSKSQKSWMDKSLLYSLKIKK